MTVRNGLLTAPLLFLLSFQAMAIEPWIKVRGSMPPNPQVLGETNFPDGTRLVLTLTRPDIQCADSQQVVVKDSKFHTVGICDDGQGLAPGKYNVVIVELLDQPPNVRAVIGARGEHMTGPLVRSADFGRNILTFRDSIEVANQKPRAKETEDAENSNVVSQIAPAGDRIQNLAVDAKDDDPDALAVGRVATTPNPGAGTATAPRADLLGIRLGMTAKEVQAVLKREKPSFVSEQVKGSFSEFPKEQFLLKIEASRSAMEGGTWADILRNPNGTTVEAIYDESLVVHFSRPPGDSRVVAITRVVHYRKQAAAPLRDKVVEAMEGKYGADPLLLEKWRDAIQLTWINTPAGEMIHDPSTHCPQGIVGISIDKKRDAWPDEDLFKAARAANDECGLTIGTQLIFDSANRVLYFSTIMTDYSRLKSSLATSNTYAKQKREAARTAQPVPKL